MVYAPPSICLENETHKLLWDFDIQTDHLMSAGRPDLIIINKKKELAELWTLLSRLIIQWNWKKKMKRGRELKKPWNMKVTIIPIVIGAFGTVTEGLFKGLKDLERRRRTSGDHPNNYIIEIGQNTEKSPGDLRRLAVT